MGMILAANPHRVFISRLGRIEVYQPIPPPTGKARRGRTRMCCQNCCGAAEPIPPTEPIPDGWIPCAHIYPPHPARDGMGEPRPFDAAHYRSFQLMMETLRRSQNTRHQAARRGGGACGRAASAIAADRYGRASIRIALRQMKAEGHEGAALGAWLAHFDQGSPEDGDDDANLHHEG